ncbi:Bin3-domain-containing protein [Gymnopus androsaceus JB14]|uniref:RNA methyltransferase n=1 Tax=Gymnopus androsaceus JB14 TaxID=1447944 RepID=A0A6A4GXY8_9AGAR|nr:Bin3-domain-containing protein [Gymnopus androsaceus JB14]
MSAPYGNYHGYYLKRPSVNDPRLALLPENIFQGKCVLDIGCNEGFVTCEIAQAWNAHKVVGVDIDDTLGASCVEKTPIGVVSPGASATQSGDGDLIANLMTLRKVFRTIHEYFDPTTFLHLCNTRLVLFPFHHRKYAENMCFLIIVLFRTADWTKESIVEDADGYDVVVAFSVSKWIHRIYSVLRPGGVFILEAQEWDTYKKVKRLNESLRATTENLKLRPNDFESVLETLGFGPARHLGTTGEGGFRRAVDLFVKQH